MAEEQGLEDLVKSGLVTGGNKENKKRTAPKPPQSPKKDIPSKLENKLGEGISEIAKSTRKPFEEGYDFFKENLPRQLYGFANIVAGAYSSLKIAGLTYSALTHYMGYWSLVPSVGLGIPAYFIGGYLAQKVLGYISHPGQTIEKAYNNILKPIVRFPFTPIKSIKSLFKSIKGIPDKCSNIYKNLTEYGWHPFEAYGKAFPPKKEEKEKKPQLHDYGLQPS